MSEYSKMYKENLFKTLREDAIPNMEIVIDNCMNTRRMLGLPKIDLPNIALAYNNQMIFLNKQFEKSGIDFFDNKECETHFAIENYFQAMILIGKNALSRYFNSISSVSVDQAREYIDSYKKPTKIEKIFKGKKYEPKSSILTEEQALETSKGLKSYNDAYNKIAYFSIEESIVEAILVYLVLSYGNGRDISSRIDSIDIELQKLGYESIKPYIEEQKDAQELTLKNLANIKSVPIKRLNTKR